MSEPQWTVWMRVTRHISVTVEASDKAEARSKAEAWDIVGDEQSGETVDCQITRISRDD